MNKCFVVVRKLGDDMFQPVSVFFSEDRANEDAVRRNKTIGRAEHFIDRIDIDKNDLRPFYVTVEIGVWEFKVHITQAQTPMDWRFVGKDASCIVLANGFQDASERAFHQMHDLITKSWTTTVIWEDL